MLAAISDFISSKYAQIPGQTAQKKTTYVALQTLKTLPWIAAGASIYKITPPKFRFTVALGSSIAAKTIPSLQVPIGFLLVYTSMDFKDHSMNFLKATQVADRVEFFAKAYVALKFASIFYSSLWTEKSDMTDSKPLKTNTSPFAMAVTASTTAGMLYYAPKTTLAGLTVGVLINTYKPSKEDVLGLDDFLPLQDATPSKAPLTTTEKLAYIWDAWNILARAIDNPIRAFYSGSLQGRKIEWFYSAIRSALSGS